MLNATEAQKKALRKIRTINSPVTEAARNTLVQGCLDQGYYIQFARDIPVYGLWEALLLAEDHFAPGAAQKALDKAISAL